MTQELSIACEEINCVIRVHMPYPNFCKLSMLELNLQVCMYHPIQLVNWPHLARVAEGLVALLNFSHEVVNHARTMN